MKLSFEKWHGCQNDFIVVWLNPSEHSLISSLQKRAPELCSKKGDGVGADGILVLSRQRVGEKLPNELTIINSDGSLAENCGNGLRCAALSVAKQFNDEELDFDLEDSVELRVSDHTYSCRFLGSQLPSLPTGTWPHVVIEMQLPLLGADLGWGEQFIQGAELHNDYALCSLGNPHLVYFNQDLSRKQELLFHAENLQKSQTIDGINVHFTSPIEPTAAIQKSAKTILGSAIEDAFEVLVYERGVGPTPACGSGACSVVATACMRHDASYGHWVSVTMPGGTVFVKQEDVESPVLLAGPAEFVFSGQLDF